MKIYGMTDTGMCRADNQDYFGACLLPLSPRIKGTRKKQKNALLAAVADGMGGVRGGEVASRLATEVFIKALAEDSGRDAESAMRRAVDAACTAVYKKAEKDGLPGMGTTLAAAIAYEDTLALLHVGDSRIYLWHDGHLLLLTHDHSVIQQMLDAGQISADEARASRYKNLITRAVGTKPHVKADFAYCLWEEGDKLLLCTDGLVGFVEESEMCSILSEDIPIEQTVRELIGAANARGAEDNITALVLENTKENPSC